MRVKALQTFYATVYSLLNFNPFFSSGGGYAACNTCGKSLLDKTVVTKADTVILKSKEALRDIKALEKMDDQQAILDLAEKILTEQRGLFHKLHYSKIGLLDKAMDACIYLEMWERALAFGLQTMHAYKLYYPTNHPSVGIQLFRIGGLLQRGTWKWSGGGGWVWHW